MVKAIQPLLGAAAPPLQDRGTMGELLEVHFPLLASCHRAGDILTSDQAAELIQILKLLQRPWTTQTSKNAKSYTYPTLKSTSGITTIASSVVSKHTNTPRHPKLKYSNRHGLPKWFDPY